MPLRGLHHHGILRGRGRIIHVGSSAQITAWYRDWDAHPGPGFFAEILHDLHHWHALALVDASTDGLRAPRGAQTPPGKPS